MATARRRRPGRERGITQLTVEGYKSLRTRHEIEIRPLTILAGVNSSGKSSALQPLLLLKQTLDIPYDPGPLLLSGPNVDVTRIEQVLSKAPPREQQANSFAVGVAVSGHQTEWRFGRDDRGDLRIHEMSGWFFPDQPKPITLREDMTSSQVRKLALRQVSERFAGSFRLVGVDRDRIFLYPTWISEDRGRPDFAIPLFRSDNGESELSRIIHLPALRGNPRRTYSTTAVEGRYPATFETYTAGVIAEGGCREGLPAGRRRVGDRRRRGLERRPGTRDPGATVLHVPGRRTHHLGQPHLVRRGPDHLARSRRA